MIGVEICSFIDVSLACFYAGWRAVQGREVYSGICVDPHTQFWGHCIRGRVIHKSGLRGREFFIMALFSRWLFNGVLLCTASI
jgi:hypothetical protein